jgi:hypothetical protein
MFCILACWTCFGSFVGHVAPMYILLHYNYPEIEKIKKGQLKFEHKIQGTNVVGKYPKPFI